MKTAEEYVESLRRRNVRLFLRGERVEHPVDHPIVAPSVRTVAESYRLAHDPAHRALFTAHSRFIDAPVNRFTHVFERPTAVAIRTESMHGEGSPQAQRVRIESQADWDEKIGAAARIAGVTPPSKAGQR